MARKDLTQIKRDSVRKLRAQRREDGRVLVSTDLPREIIEAIDAYKIEHGIGGRTAIIEQALREFFKLNAS